VSHDKKAIEHRHDTFIVQYLKNFNATEAAIVAGYSPKTAGAIGCQLLGLSVVQAKLQEALNEQMSKHKLQLDQIVKELGATGFSNIADYLDVHEDGSVTLNFSRATRVQMSAVQSIKTDERILRTALNGDQIVSRQVTLKMHNKIDALDKLMRYFGGYLGKEGGGGGDTYIDARQVNIGESTSPEDAAKAYQRLLGRG